MIREVPRARKPRDARATPGGRFEVLNEFVRHRMRDLAPAEAMVWFVLYTDARARTGTAAVGQAVIAARCGLTTRYVKKAIAGLVRKGVVTVARRGRKGAGVSRYRVHLPVQKGNSASPPTENTAPGFSGPVAGVVSPPLAVAC